jgi:hypothetical protein
MATAPPPVEGGYDAREFEERPAEKGPRTLIITVRRAVRLKTGDPIVETHRLIPDAVPFKERQIIRKAAGSPLEEYLGAFGLDSLQVLWWVARRQNGDQFLTLDRALEEWPENVGPDDIDLAEDDGEPEATSPEA